MKKKVQLRTVTIAIKPTAADHSFNIFVDTFLVLLLIIIAIPLWSTITLSFRPYDYIGNNLQGMFLAPWKWSLFAYKALLGNAGFLLAFKNSFKILVGGVATALVLTIPLAYVLSIPTLPGRRALNILIILPYVFNVGMIPSYLLVTNLGLIDKIAAVFLPGAISTYNCLIMRSF
ncbi:MAG TPA: carbohydrate ABC transporter permease, partial [Sphaerochaeta sp.]|nr:carbohydrate ABC transporter permease [Sphaerochaeta sp.]